MKRWETLVARRYLWAARKHAHTAFLSIISMLGLAVGVATLLISLALLSGLQGQIKSRLIASSPMLLIEPVGRNTITDAAAIAAAAHQMGVRSIEPLVTGISWGANEKEKHGRPIRVRSYDEHDDPQRDSSSPRDVRLADGNSGIMLTRDAAAAINLNLGDEITVVAPRTRLTPFGPVPVWRKYTIVRLLVAATDERAAEARLPLQEAESLFGTGGNPTSIEMRGETDAAEAVQTRLIQRFPGVQVKTWKEINHPLFLALRLEKIVMFATISLIIFVAALNLISSLSMLIMEKRPQVGVLRTLGATEGTIRSLFLQAGLFIGLSGTLLGNILGVGFSWAANRFHLVPLPNDIYFINYLPFTLDRSDVLAVNVIAVVLSVVATWYPARIASRLDPITAIRE